MGSTQKHCYQQNGECSWILVMICINPSGAETGIRVYTFYASTFRHQKHYVFRLSVCPSIRPSVQSLKYPLSTCTWVRWSIRPTVTIFRPNRSSVRPSEEVSRHFPEEWPEWRNGLKFCIMYLDHLQNWLDYGHSLLIFLLLAPVWLRETGEIWGFQAFSRERMEGMAWNFACWYILTTFRTG